MSAVGGRKNKKQAADKQKMVSKPWKEEEEDLRKDTEDLKTWIDMIETMDDQELKGYVETHAGEIKLPKIPKPRNKVQSTVKSKSSSSSNNGILASVWRFHKN